MDGNFELCEPFNIDNGELEGMSPQACFVLGYELADVVEWAQRVTAESERVVHAANRDRLQMFLNARNIDHTFTWPADDVSEAWVYLRVTPQNTENYDAC